MQDKIALMSLLVTIFIQSMGGIWWASRLQTTQEVHANQLAKLESQRETYPVLENRVTNLEANVGKMVQKMDELLEELRSNGIRGTR